MKLTGRGLAAGGAAFDKGIDYDRDQLRKGKVALQREWDNGIERKISGRREQPAGIARRFSLSG